MAAKILFFGQDDRRCIPAIKRAGYSVDEYHSAVQMRPELVEDRDAAAVAVSGVWEPFLDDPISVIRSRTSIPFVLFAAPGEPSAPSIFDLVIQSDRRPSEWLIDLDVLIRECRETCAQARRVMATSTFLNQQAAIAIEMSRLERERSRMTREQSRMAREQSRMAREQSRMSREQSFRVLSKTLVDIAGAPRQLEETPGVADFLKAPPISATPCEERDRLNWSIMMALAALTNLLWKIMRVRVDNETPDQLDALQAEERRQSESLEALLVQWKAHRAAHGC